MSAAEEGLVYELVLPRMDNVEGLTLVPEYSKSGEHADEAISIEKIVPVIDLYNTIFPKTKKARKAHHADPGIGLVLIADAQRNGQRINGDPVFKRNVIPEFLDQAPGSFSCRRDPVAGQINSGEVFLVMANIGQMPSSSIE